MPTKTFSSRADAQKLSFANGLTRRELGMSFGQYCGSVVLDSICESASLPDLGSQKPASARVRAAEALKGISTRFSNPEIAQLSDAEVRDLLASRYA